MGLGDDRAVRAGRGPGVAVACGSGGGTWARSPPASRATLAAVVGCGPASEVSTIATVIAAMTSTGAAKAT